MIFIDGGHDRKTVTSDSNNAFRMLSNNRSSCIAWHDFNSSNHPDITDVLNELSKTYDIFHIEDTSLCFYLNCQSYRIVEELNS